MAVPTREELSRAAARLRELGRDRDPIAGSVRLELEDQVADLVIDNPSARHAFTVDMMAELAEAVLRLGEWEGALIRVRASTPEAFCAGGHLGQVRAWLGTPEAGAVMAESMAVTLDALGAHPAISVAVLQGPAVGGGAEVAMASDLRVAAPTFWMQWRQTRLGVVAGWGGAQRLLRRLGEARAMRLMLDGEAISATEALSLGLVDEVAEDPSALTDAWFGRWLSRGPEVVRAVKAQLRACNRAESAAVFGTLWGGPHHRRNQIKSSG